MTKEQLLAEAKALDPAAREQLIVDLLQIGEEDDLSAEQRAELRRRLEAMDCGETTLIPGDQVMRDVRQRLER